MVFSMYMDTCDLTKMRTENDLFTLRLLSINSLISLVNDYIILAISLIHSNAISDLTFIFLVHELVMSLSSSSSLCQLETKSPFIVLLRLVRQDNYLE